MSADRSEYHRAYYAANRESRLAHVRAYYVRHREERAAYARKYRKDHPDVIAAYTQKNIVRIRGLAKVRRDALYRRVTAQLRALKLLRGCVDCGYRANADALEFDHVRGKKYVAVSALWNSAGLLAAEIAKCEVRCANCHAIITQARRREKVA